MGGWDMLLWVPWEAWAWLALCALVALVVPELLRRVRRAAPAAGPGEVEVRDVADNEQQQQQEGGGQAPAAGQAPPAVQVTVEQQPPAVSAEQLGRVREQLIAANPGAVPELIAGETLDALLGSVEGAKEAGEAYRRRLNVQSAALASPGGGNRGGVDPAAFESLSPEAKIQAALNDKQQR